MDMQGREYIFQNKKGTRQNQLFLNTKLLLLSFSAFNGFEGVGHICGETVHDLRRFQKCL